MRMIHSSSRRLDDQWRHGLVVTVITLLLQLFHAVHAGRGLRSSASTTTSAARKFWWHEKYRAPQIHGLLRSVPALSQKRSTNDQFDTYLKTTQEVAVKTKKPSPRSIFPSIPGVSPEFFLGITPQTMKSLTSVTHADSSTKIPQKKRVDLREGMSEALEELRSMRHEMEQMRQDLLTLKRLQMGEDYVDPEAEAQSKTAVAHRQRKRQREFEQLSNEVERWAEEILFPRASDEGQAEGWTEVFCNKMLKGKYNRDGHTKAYLKWMKDSRGPSSVTKKTIAKDDDQEWPCIRLYSTIEAPCHEVSLYLSQERHVGEYNQLLDQHKDLEEITPHSKICWAQSPQILFIKPRDFVTFCSHRWRRDGTQVVVNQACDSFDDVTANAFALRGATFIGPDPDDPEKTRIAMLAHASPGKDIPGWACRTAIQSLAPIEPYRLFYKINEGVKRSRTELQAMNRRLNEAEMVGNNTAERSSRHPAGLAQMGFACFWPNGGGEKEGFVMPVDDHSEKYVPTPMSLNDVDDQHIDQAISVDEE